MNENHKKLPIEPVPIMRSVPGTS